ncbi:hypothetical protein Tco_0542608 [Tanacetum coccineum]
MDATGGSGSNSSFWPIIDDNGGVYMDASMDNLEDRISNLEKLDFVDEVESDKSSNETSFSDDTTDENIAKSKVAAKSKDSRLESRKSAMDNSFTLGSTEEVDNVKILQWFASVYLISKIISQTFDIGSNQMDDDDDFKFFPPYTVAHNPYEFIPSFANEDESNYNYYMMYKNQKYDLDNAMKMRNKNVIEDESHFIMKVVDNDLGGGGFVVLGGRSSRESKNACGEVGGVEKMSSTGFKFMVRREECLEGCVGAGGGEVNGGRDDFGVSKSLLGEIPGVVIGESSGEVLRDDGGAV